MKTETTSYFCDICKQEVNETELQTIERMPVIFTTEQNEGRTCEPYLSFVKIELCQCCLFKAVGIRVTWAMGHNGYRIKYM